MVSAAAATVTSRRKGLAAACLPKRYLGSISLVAGTDQRLSIHVYIGIPLGVFGGARDARCGDDG